MIRMLSGVLAPVIGGLGKLFKRGGKVSAYRIVLAATFAAVFVGLWTGWAQWIFFGEGIAEGGFGVGLGMFAARWVAGAILAIVLLWTMSSPKDKGDVIGFSITVMLVVSAFATAAQAMYTHGAFAMPERTHYRATVSCGHCGASCYVYVGLGESWTDWPSVECCHCGIKVSPEMVPEYDESRDAWDTRILDGGGDGTQD